jgi:hypothetical protein
VAFFKKAKLALNENGVIIVKENHAIGEFIVDKSDSTVTRSSELFKKIFNKAGL